MKFQSIIPILHTQNIQQSFAYYTEQLGFEKRWEWGDPVDFGCVGKDDVDIFFCLNGQGHPGTWLCLNVDNVDSYYEFIKLRGANILSEPKDQEWNMREMLVGDPDHNIIRFGHRLPETDCE